MFEDVHRFVKEKGLLTPGDTVVVGVSGGADSVALLDILSRCTDLGLSLVVAHLNHSLRGTDSDEDEAFVCALARRHGLRLVTKRVDVAARARSERFGLEEAGRLARYAFFDEVASSCNARRIALAHHADDQAETVLMRLLRGSGTTGLAAMAPASADGRHVRPLLAVSRQDIEAYLIDRGLSWRVDQSNDDTSFLRNRIRHELIPALRTYNPAIAGRLAVTAELLREDETVLDQVTADAFVRLSGVDGDTVFLHVPGVRQEKRGLRLRLYRHAIGLLQGSLQRIASCHLFDVDGLLMHDRPQALLNLPDGLVVKRSYDRLFVHRGEGEGDPLPYAITVTGPGVYPLPGGGQLVVELGAHTSREPGPGRPSARFDLHKAPFPWLVRPFLPGDRLAPSGMAGSKKVKKLFIEAKIPTADRRRIPLLFSGATLLWVAGVRTSGAGSVDGATTVVACVEIRDSEA